MRLTPALGQQKIYVLVFTTEKDLQQTTTLVDPAKAYAKGTGNSVPDIPDPLARHTTDGLVKLKVSTNSASSVLVGPLFGSSGRVRSPSVIPPLQPMPRQLPQRQPQRPRQRKIRAGTERHRRILQQCHQAGGEARRCR